MRTRTSRMEPALPALTAIALACGIAASHTATASSHREAPFITTAPKVDGTDFYMFRSSEAGRASVGSTMCTSTSAPSRARTSVAIRASFA